MPRGDSQAVHFGSSAKGGQRGEANIGTQLTGSNEAIFGDFVVQVEIPASTRVLGGVESQNTTFNREMHPQPVACF